MTIGREQDGAVAVLLALMLAALLGVMALAVDLGRAWNLDTELQNAADAAALAGGTQLDGQPGARARAIQAAAGAIALAKNTQRFATDGGGSLVVIDSNPDPAANTDVKFYVDLTKDGAGNLINEATTDQGANYIEVTVQPRRVDFMFAALVGAVSSASPSARAVAGLGQAMCSTLPMYICNPAEDVGAEPFEAAEYEGIGLQLKMGDGGVAQWGPGNYGLLAVSNTLRGAAPLKILMGAVESPFPCNGDEGLLTKPGQVRSLAQGLNVRFDIYESPKFWYDDPNYRPSRNPVKGLIKVGPKCTFDHKRDDGWVKPAKPFGYHPLANLNGVGPRTWQPGDPDPRDLIDAMGFPRDDCHYPYNPSDQWSLGVDGGCIILTPQPRIGSGVWDIDTYFAVNHAGTNWILLDLPDNPVTGMPTRHEVYKWELTDYPYNLPGWPSSIEEIWPASNQCYDANSSPPAPTDPDRRVITIAVVNCIASGLEGRTLNLDVESYLNVFLTEPVGTFIDNKDIYGEVINEATRDTNPTMFKSVLHLYE